MSIKDDFPSSSICKLQNHPAWRNLGSPNTKPLYRNIPSEKIDFFKLEVPLYESCQIQDNSGQGFPSLFATLLSYSS